MASRQKTEIVFEAAPISHIIVGAVALALGVFRPQQLYLDGDIFRRLAFGRLIAEAQSLPSADPFLWGLNGAVQGSSAVRSGWLFDLLSYLFTTLFQFIVPDLEPLSAVALLQGLLVLGSAGALLRFGHLQNFSVLAQTIAAALYLLLTWSLWNFGPTIWAILLYPLIMSYVLTREKKGGFTYGLIFFLTVLWANIDPAVALLPIVLTLFLLGAFIEGNREDLREFGLLLLLIVPASALTPSGIDGYRYFFSGFGSNNLFLQIASGWQTPDFHRYPLLPVGIIATLIALLSLRETLPKRYLIVLPALLILSLLSLKCQVPFAFLAAFIVGTAVTQRDMRSVLLDKTVSAPLASALLVSAFLIVGVSLFLSKRPDLEPRLDKDWFVNPSSQNLFRGRILNDINVAGELSRASIPIFIDNRVALNTVSLEPSAITGTRIGDYAELVQIGERWREVLERWTFDTAVIRTDSSLATILQEIEGWKTVAQTPPNPKKVKGRTVDFGISVLRAPELQ